MSWRFRREAGVHIAENETMLPGWTRLLSVVVLMSTGGGLVQAAAAKAKPGQQPARAAAAHRYDLVIRNGRVMDGSGNSWFYDDVGVRNGKIVTIGRIAPGAGTKEIDATGLVVAPGFIDVHTHADEDLHKHPRAENFIRDGVTTIVTGNCGSSVTDVRGYFHQLEKKGVAVNVATLIGHNSILRAVKGDRAGKLTTAQMDKAKQMVRQAMLDGAVGMSTGLIYTPGTYSETEEIIELQKVAAEYGGIYATHMRDEAREILAAIDEALRVGRESGSRVQISHFKMPTDVARSMGGSKVTLARVMEARAAGQEVWLDQYPYTASSTGIASLLPSWVREEGNDRARQVLQDPASLERVLADMRQSHEIERQRRDMSYAVISSCSAYPEYVGKNIKQIAQMMKRQREQAADASAGGGDELPEVTSREQYLAIIDIFLKGGASCVFHSLSEEQVENIMRHPLTAVCSDSGVRVFGEGQPHPRGYGSNSRVLGRYVRERGVITLEEAIRKMTSMPALAFRFKDRGLLREGFWADITIFDPQTVADQATFEQPHQYAKGIIHVIVNGQPVVENEEVTGALPGMPLYGPGRVDK